MTNESPFIYKPPITDLTPCVPSFGVKFCNDFFLSKLWLDDHNITYQDSELEETPYGLCIRIKRG